MSKVMAILTVVFAMALADEFALAGGCGGGGGKSKPAKPAKLTTVAGKIVQILNSQNAFVVLPDGKTDASKDGVKIKVTAKTTVTINDKQATLADLKADMVVTVTEADDVATKIAATTPPPASTPPTQTALKPTN